MIFGEEGFEPDPFAETCFILEGSGEAASFLLFFAFWLMGSSCLCTEPSKCAPDSIAIVLWIMSPSTRAVDVSLTFKPLTRPTIRPFITTSSATTSPLIVALSPIVNR